MGPGHAGCVKRQSGMSEFGSNELSGVEFLREVDQVGDAQVEPSVSQFHKHVPMLMRRSVAILIFMISGPVKLDLAQLAKAVQLGAHQG